MAILPNTIEKPVIDLSTEAGNVFFLIAQAVRLGKLLNKDVKGITQEMMSSGYENAINTFDREFGEFIDLKLPETIPVEKFKENLKSQTYATLRKNMTPEKLADAYTR